VFYLNEWFINLVKDGSFIGSLLGAILSGLVAILVLIKGIKHQNNLFTKTEIGDFLREATYLSNSVTSLEMMIKEYIKHQRHEEMLRLPDEIGNDLGVLSEIRVFKEMNGQVIKNILSKIQSVDRKAFNYEGFDLYLEIINLCEKEIEFFWNRSMNNRVSGVADMLDKYITELSELNHQLNKLIQQQKKRIKKL